MGLYSNILHGYGLEAIQYWFDKFLKSLHPRFSKEIVLESVKFILENNNLKFDNDDFSQIKGTVMGTIFPLRSICTEEVLRLIAGKVVMNILKKDVINAPGSLQVCAGQ